MNTPHPKYLYFILDRMLNHKQHLQTTKTVHMLQCPPAVQPCKLDGIPKFNDIAKRWKTKSSDIFAHFFIFIPDINKFLWMVRIGGSTDLGSHIHEKDYFTPSGEFRVDKEGSPILHNCLMYKMSYYRFGSVYTESGMHRNCSIKTIPIY